MNKKFTDRFKKDKSTLIIAEIGQAHDGSLGIAESYIDAVADAGADAIKFQTHIASEESTYDDNFRINFSNQDKNRFEYWKRMEFTQDQWSLLFKKANEKNLLFLSSAFSMKAMKMLIELGVPAIKIASGEISNTEMMKYIKKQNIPVLISTGMSSWDEIDRAIESFLKSQIPIVLMQCTSKYPTPLEEVGLNVIDEMKKRYNTYIGLSDHSGTTFPALAAISRGIDVLEVHVTFDKKLFGPDTSSSLTIDELREIVDFRNKIKILNNSTINKDEMSAKLSKTKKLFNKSICLISSQKKGTVITKDLICYKKPGTGISEKEVSEVIGKKLKSNYSNNYLLKWENLE